MISAVNKSVHERTRRKIQNISRLRVGWIWKQSKTAYYFLSSCVHKYHFTSINNERRSRKKKKNNKNAKKNYSKSLFSFPRPHTHTHTQIWVKYFLKYSEQNIPIIGCSNNSYGKINSENFFNFNLYLDKYLFYPFLL